MARWRESSRSSGAASYSHARSLNWRLGVPGHAGKLALAIFPFCAGEDARRDFDQTWRQLEHGKSGPGLSVASAERVLVQRLRHMVVGVILHDHLSKMVQNLHFGGVLFQMQAVAGDAGAVGDFLAGS